MHRRLFSLYCCIILIQCNVATLRLQWVWFLTSVLITITVALVCERLYRPSDRRLSAKLVPSFADREVSCGQRSGSFRQEQLLFLSRSSSILLTSPSGHVPGPLLVRKSGSAGIRIRTSGSVARNYHSFCRFIGKANGNSSTVTKTARKEILKLLQKRFTHYKSGNMWWIRFCIVDCYCINLWSSDMWHHVLL
jgi:hypothetical protein